MQGDELRTTDLSGYERQFVVTAYSEPPTRLGMLDCGRAGPFGQWFAGPWMKFFSTKEQADILVSALGNIKNDTRQTYKYVGPPR